MVGASFGALIVNSAPFAPYDRVVPVSNVQNELAPAVKSVVMVVPKAGSAGHDAIEKRSQNHIKVGWRGGAYCLTEDYRRYMSGRW